MITTELENPFQNLMGTLIIHSWYIESWDLDNNKPLEKVISKARITIDGSEINLKGDPSMIKNLLALIRCSIKKEVMI